MAGDLINRLDQASAGHVATYGDAVPNLFADALAEIEHLRKLEDAAQRLDSGYPTNEYRPGGYAVTLEQQTKTRREAAALMLSLVRPWGKRP